ncbi:M55 family metallopeptidase [Geoalkalibacter sp.]|uniref:M55 family metallopeptidase n=1 Tax=Geoalkalibacter sp. TaxID=3041440 RepID=UPI00272EE30F|nr:M55 family metallopeptidase [Geoalkalibacter sp.]
MKFMIAVDCDGPACVVGEPGRALSDSRDMGFAREQATRETDAAARALFDAGAEKVVVWDNHGVGANLVFDRLDRRCEVLLGAGFKRRFPQLDETYAGVLMIGYHAMEGTPGAVLAHTYSPGAYRAIRVHGETVGEMALDAAVAGEWGVPPIFVASDDLGCREALSIMPWIETVATKQGFGRNCAFSKHPAVAEEQIYLGVRRAVARLDEMRPLTFAHPVRVEIEFKKWFQACKARVRRQGWRFAGARTLGTELVSMLDFEC